MPKKLELKCYFGCLLDGPLHRFPKYVYPEKTEKFEQWKSVLDSDTQRRGNDYIYNNIRLCHRHFEKCFQLPSHLLTKNAIPTLNLVHKQKARLEQCSSEIEAESILNLQPSSSGTKRKISIDIPEAQPELKIAKSSTCDPPPANEDKVKASAQVTALPIPPVATFEEIRKEQKEEIKSKPRPVISSKKRPHTQHDISQVTISRLKEKLDKMRKKYKSQSKQILAAKRMSQSKSFVSVLNKMPTASRTLVEMQLKYKKKPRGRRFTTNEKIMALTIWKQGPKVYKLLRKMFVLPSQRSLQKLLSAITFKPGINKDILNDLKIVVKKMSAEKRIVNLLFDEMSLQPGLQYNASLDEISGFEDYGDDKKLTLADHALVFMIKGVKGKTKQPICFTFCQSATKKETLKRLITIIIKELREAGLKVIATVCDQSATNVSVIRSLQNDTKAKYLKESKEFHSKSFEIDDIKVYPLFDPPHLLKGVRNNLLKNNAIFTQNGKIKRAKWEHIEMLFDIDEGDDEVRLLNKLTENHIKKDKIPKMKVKFAAQVFSQRVSAVMRFLAKRDILPAECEDTADFLLIFDKLFDSFNGHSYRDDSKIFKSCLKNNSPHFKLWADLIPVLQSIQFETVEKKGGGDVIKRKSIPSITNWIHNMKCFVEIWNDLNKNSQINNLIMRNFNQDPLEIFFSSIRSHGVRNNNPTCDQFTNAFKTLIINNFNSPHSPGANCEKDDNHSIQSLKNLISNNCEQSKSDFAFEIDPILNIMNEMKNPENLIDIESKKYVTGYVVKKCKSKIFKNCSICSIDFCRSQADVDSFNYEIDYTKKSLFHPNEKITNLLNEIYFVIVACLRRFPQSKSLKSKINFIVDCVCDFNVITCSDHKSDLIDYIKNLACNVIIYSWCNNVNRILNGKFLKYDRSDSIKQQAYNYYVRRKSKK